MKKYIDYLFEDAESGERFFVEICKNENVTEGECFARALNIANENFNEPTFICEVNPEEAETYGYDTY